VPGTLVKTHAAVLAATDWSESSQVVTLYCRALGKVRGLAKGSRRRGRSFNAFDGAFEAGACGEVVLSHKPQGLSTITERWTTFSLRRAARDLARQYAALFALETANTLTAVDDPHPEVYMLLRETLQAAEHHRDPRIASLACAFKLLRILGFLSDVSRCAGCGEPVARSERHAVDPEQAGVICPSCRNDRSRAIYIYISGASLATFDRMVSQPIDVLGRLCATDAVTAELAGVVDGIVKHLTSRSLRTLQYMKKGNFLS